jgi:hypothetical protein
MSDSEKTGIAWIGTILGYVTLSDVVLVATLIFTILQILLALRKLIKGR